MAKEPESRYLTARELADDLHRFLEYRPIHARRPTLAARASKWARRHLAAVVTGGVVAAGDFALHVVGSGLSGFGIHGLSGSLAMGAVAFFVVAAAGALWRARPSRAIRWARSNPWRFAVMPAIVRMADLGLDTMWNDKPVIARWYDEIRAHKAFEPTYYFCSLLTERFPHLKERAASRS